MCVYTEQMSNKLLTVFHKGFAGFIGGSDGLENEAERKLRTWPGWQHVQVRAVKSPPSAH